MKLKPISFLLAMTLAPWAHGVDLLDAYHAAQGQDSVFAAARASHQAGQEKLTQGRALLLPNVNLVANSNFNDLVTNSATNARFGLPNPYNSRYNSHGYSVSLVQPLFRPQNWLAYSQSELQVAIADAQFRAAEQELVLRVAQTYFDVLMAQDNVQLAEAQKTAIAEQLAQAKRNFEVGSATVTDVYEAQARHDLINSQQIAAQSNLLIKRRALQQLTGSTSDELRALNQELKLDPPQPAVMSSWIETASQNNPQVTAAQAGAELADKEATRNMAGHAPTADLVASYGQNYANGGSFGVGSDVRSTVVGVQVTVPIFQGMATQSRWREAEANRERARQDLETARRNVELQTQQAYLGVESGIAQVGALQQALKSSSSLLDASKLGQEVGVRTNLDVLNAQQQLYATRRDLYQAEYNFLMSRLRLKAAAGDLSEADLASVNQALY
ncbi:TolC family outer membrane protein [Ferriphaselus sp. R-1]|uniref:TolC family outer membrane protein n=1 Tax=Ferriphaselus sp. R-1 TaxID=1485544 RepID=UPI0005521B5D|nr:TolC family outer membrane protein [Ferriphaselus sp. R-1]